MEATKMSIEEVARHGEALYAQGLRAKVENDENIGKVLVIDVETGECAIDDTGIDGSRLLHVKRPDAPLYGIRIGYRAMETFGGMRVRTAS